MNLKQVLDTKQIHLTSLIFVLGAFKIVYSLYSNLLIPFTLLHNQLCLEQIPIFLFQLHITVLINCQISREAVLKLL